MFADMMEDAEDDDDQAKIEYVPRKTKSYPSEKETDTFGRDSSVPNLNGPIWLNPNIEIKIGDLGNACWEVKICIYRRNNSKLLIVRRNISRLKFRHANIVPWKS